MRYPWSKNSEKTKTFNSIFFGLQPNQGQFAFVSNAHLLGSKESLKKKQLG